MDQDEQDQQRILEEQLKWIEEQVRILDEMDSKLYEMKEIAEYARENKLSAIEIERLNDKLNVLKNEYSSLEKQYNPILH